MQHRYSSMIMMLLIVIGLLVGCSAPPKYEKIQPYELIKGEDGINTVILTEKASERLVMESVPVVEEEINGDTRLVVPYHALIYDNYGGTWVYVNPEPLTYMRAEVTVDFIEGDKVVLTAGPEVGTQVAIASVAELYGTDTGVGK